MPICNRQGRRSGQVMTCCPDLKILRRTACARHGLAAIPARFALERGRWDEAAQLPVRDSQFPAAQSNSYFVRALGAARSGDRRQPVPRSPISTRSKQSSPREGRLLGWTNPHPETGRNGLAYLLRGSSRWRICRDARGGRSRRRQREERGDGEQARTHPRAIRRTLSGGRYEQRGTAEFEASLKSMPNRYRMLAGAATAARAVGMVDAAKRDYRALTALVAAGEAQRPELAEAKSFLSQN